MSKDILTAEKFYRQENGLENMPHLTKSENEKIAFAEAYHKAKVESITDEEIKNNFTTQHYSNDIGNHYRVRKDRIFGAKWFKNKLLNS